jgi:hypothetical protein
MEHGDAAPQKIGTVEIFRFPVMVNHPKPAKNPELRTISRVLRRNRDVV